MTLPTPRFEHEGKYLLPPSALAPALLWLRATCRRDPRFDLADVHTIYYDGPDWPLLEEKENSDYHKTKIRLRWYERAGMTQGEGVFIEIKQRAGSRRIKRRWPSGIAASRARAAPLEGAPFDGVVAALHRHGEAVATNLRPALLLRYRRHRFIEPCSQLRLALDCDLAVLRTHRARLAPPPPGALPIVVLEVKGAAGGLPGVLRPLLALGVRRASFSKYRAAFSQLEAAVPAGRAERSLVRDLFSYSPPRLPSSPGRR